MKSGRVRSLFLTIVCLALLAGSLPGVFWARGPVTARAEALDAVALHAAGWGTPWLNLRDGAPLAATYEGADPVAQAVASGAARPLSLAAADFDEDGVPDLVVGYGAPAGLALHRGNVDAIYPNAPEAQRRRAEGRFIDAPFLPQAPVFALPVTPDFLGAGDFDNDGHRDVVAASRGGTALTLLPGDGLGGFGPPETVSLPGGVTALAVGDVNRRDGLADVAVGITDLTGSRFAEPVRSAVLIFEGPAGALRAEPEAIAAPAEVTGLAIGQLDEHYAIDLAAAAGRELLVVQGRDRMLSLDAESRAQVQPAVVARHRLPFEIATLALGNFAEEAYPLEVALLDGAGTVHILDPTTAESKAQGSRHKAQGSRHKAQFTIHNSQLVRANVSSHPTDDLLTLDAANHNLHILNTQYQISNPQPVLAALPMRLNKDALDDLVLLTEDGPAVSLTAPANTFVVNSTGDEGDPYAADGICDICNNPDADPPVGPCGVCTLRAAVIQANGDAGHDYIDFAIPGTGPHTINIGNFLWATGPVAIDGTTQAGYDGTPLIEVSGGQTAFYISGGDSLVRGLAVNGALYHGIQLDTHGNSKVEGCYVGTDVTGTQDKGNGEIGVAVADIADNVIGGTTEAARNVISGNDIHGVQISDVTAATLNKVVGNYIGTDVNGTADLGNEQHGVVVYGAPNNDVGGTTQAARNVVAASELGYGIVLADYNAAGNLVAGNYVGTGANGTGALGHELDGIAVVENAHHNNVGGTAGVTPGGACTGACNVSAFNDGSGVYVGPFNPLAASARTSAGAGPTPAPALLVPATGSPSSRAPSGADGNLVRGNHIGIDPAGTAPQGNGNAGVLVSEGADNTIGGERASAGNTIAASAGCGVQIGSSGDTVRPTGNRVQGNYIGVNAGAKAGRLPGAALNNEIGVCLYWADDNVVGGPTEAEGNVIARNNQDGVLVTWSNQNRIAYNVIGADASGVSDQGNGRNGVYLLDSAGNVVEYNHISGNDAYGVRIRDNLATAANAAGNQVRSNLIGTAGEGVAALPNSKHGVLVEDAYLTQIEGNVISGNNGDGVVLKGGNAQSNQVTENKIGVTIEGNWPRGNGVSILGASSNLVVANTVSDNGKHGVLVQGPGASGNVLQQNLIGLDLAGAVAYGNTLDGVHLKSAAATQIGGGPHERNYVSGNQDDGIEVEGTASLGNLIQQNYVGVGSDGQTAARNQDAGLEFSASASGNTVQGNRLWHNCRGVVDTGENVYVGNSLKKGFCPFTGVVCDGCASTLTGNEIAEDAGDGIRCLNGGQPLVRDNNVLDNAGYGLNNLDLGVTVDAHENWWGAADGPGGSGPGSGDEVSDAVDYADWLGQPVSLVAAVGDDPLLALPGTTVSTPLFFQNWDEPADTLDVTLADTQGWLQPPLAATTSLSAGLGAALPVSFTLPGGAAFGATDAVTATATSQADPSDAVTVTSQVLAVEAADLAVVQAVNTDTVAVGGQLYYTLTISNAGPEGATGVVVTDTLPAELAFVSATPDQGTCSEAGGVIVCEVGSLGNGEQTTIHVVATLPAPTETSEIINYAEVRGDQYDLVPYNDLYALFTWAEIKPTAIYLPLVMRQSP